MDDLEFEDGYVVVYIDGACRRNGQPGAQAGIGVFFGDDHPWNVSRPIQGRATNNNAEIQAARVAVEIVKRFDFDSIQIVTDSDFLYKSMTKYIYKWMENGWLTAKREPVKNKKEFVKLWAATEDMEVNWVWVEAHNDDYGNEMADDLAREGARRCRPQY